MRNFVAALLVGLMLFIAQITLADSSSGNSNFSGNQLMQSQVHWYEKAAESVAPVGGITSGKGPLLTLSTGSYLYMEGDSTLHKYQMRAGSLKGSASLKAPLVDSLAKPLKEGQVGSMSLVVPVQDFKSRESGLDNNAYKALKATDNPEIKFVLEKESLKPGDKDGSFVMTAKGNLTVAGVTAPVTLTADTTVSGGKVELKGVQKLKMSDFKITPPSISLLITAITCSDEIEIYYDVVFAPEGKAPSEANK